MGVPPPRTHLAGTQAPRLGCGKREFVDITLRA
jgi:hypothetical protein